MRGVPTSFPYHRSGSTLTFPRDEGWHRSVAFNVANPSLDQMEWVYLNAHLDEVGGQGRHFVVFAAYFTQHLRFLVVRGWDASGASLGAWTGSAWGVLTASSEELDLEFRHLGGKDHWSSLRDPSGAVRPFCSKLVARDDAASFTVDLELVATKAPYEVGGVGYLPFGDRGAFHYYSVPRLGAQGFLSLTTASGIESIAVKGLGWFDHQWGPFFVTPFRLPLLEQYEWMSIQLDSGDDFLLTTVWDPSNQTPSRESHGGAGWIRPDGSSEHLARQDLWRRIGFWRSPSQGSIYASGWTFEAPAWNVQLTITPRQLDQLTPIIDAPLPGVLGELAGRVLGGAPNFLGEFWEGSCTVTGTLGGAPVKGVAFAELSKRYEEPRFELELIRHEPGLSVLTWRVTNWDPQATVTYRAYLERPDGAVLKSWPTLTIPVLALDDAAFPVGEPLVVRVVAHNADGTLTGTRTFPLALR